ncbi:efflux RND transporter periplasmic adaptor subunit [Thetidibacter halocola]|uniref:Efflux RND transporter periplasmic adaptor subunit n=1 Tax=Thetidibacter halocola TaxID=2827239 RepID=A0A8J7W948_9RHOB|nr:efflux RND transporter periplasmic adaptor subunit [Thetidibacter halocola]MBS0123155.1 efflux RND transporter periplasmic adaptor subunit [Thetidibacter halocola]
MRLFPILTAIIVAGLLYALVMQRDALLEFARGGAPVASEATPAAAPAETADATPETETDGLPEGTVRVMATRSVAQEVGSAVVLRGETEALREVEVRAETSGKIVSEPLRRGVLVEAGQLLCEIDPGTRAVSLQEAQARLAEARARVPEAAARLLEAEAAVPAAQARIAEAEAAIPAAQAGLLEARARIPAAQAALGQAEAGVPEAEARLSEARSRVREAEINLTAASELARDGFAAQTRLAGAEAGYESAKAQVQTALSGVKGAEADVEQAKSTVEGARAALESALSQIEGVKAAAISAKSAYEGALAGVESAKAAAESARSAIQSAEAAVASVENDIDRLTITAPFAGLLETDTAELGALMQPGSACATVIQLDPIKLVAFVPETEIARVEPGARAGAELVDGRRVAGTVSFVSRSADPVTRTFRVELTVANGDLTIRDGQTADIAIEAEGAPAHLLPASSLTLDDDGTLGVRTVAEDGTAQFMAVTLLRDSREGVWVSGLPDMVDVITVGQEYVTDGVPVEPSFEEVIQ